MADLNDIFSHSDSPLSDEELRKYFDEKTSEEEKHAIEKKMAASPFEDDAFEGLGAFEHKDKLNDYVRQLNKQLNQQLAVKKSKKEKRKIKDIPLIVLAVVVILVLIILGYLVIRLNS